MFQDAGFLKASAKQSIKFVGRPRLQRKMCPAAGAPKAWESPPICSAGELARRVNLAPNELAWFADCRMQEAKLPEGEIVGAAA
jgi:hypothetical protein